MFGWKRLRRRPSIGFNFGRGPGWYRRAARGVKTKIYNELEHYPWWNASQKAVMEEEMTSLMTVESQIRSRIEWLAEEIIKRGGPSDELKDADITFGKWWGSSINPLTDWENHKRDWKF